MPISSFLAPSAIAKPGVCTSSTRPASPYEGQVIYTTDLDTLEIWNGTAWRILALSAPTQGAVLQTVTASTQAGVTNNTSTYADTGLSATITPKSSSSKILIQVSQICGKTNGNAENRIQLQLLRGSSGLIDSGDLGFYTSTAIYNIGEISLTYLDSPATTSATTYKTMFRNVNGTAGVAAQYGSGWSTIILMEIAA